MGPKTKSEAEAYRYHQWSGCPKGVRYQPEKCAEEVFSNWLPRQCSRKPGHGTEGIFCKQHAKYHPAE